MTDDNGYGLGCLFYGLCRHWDIEVWDQQRLGPIPSDFCFPSPKFPAHVVIAPGPADRQVEIAALRQRCVPFVILNRQDLEDFRLSPGPEAAVFVIEQWIAHGTHASAERERMGLGR